MNKLSERLRAGIHAVGLNITQASESTGIPYRSLQNYLRGEREPKADVLAQIGARLGISLDWLFTGEGSPLRAKEGEKPTGTFSPEEEAVLTLYRALDKDAQREICAVAEEKKRLREVEREIKALQTSLAARKRSA